VRYPLERDICQLLLRMCMMRLGVNGMQVLVFVVFAATDARRASLEAHIPVSAVLLLLACLPVNALATAQPRPMIQQHLHLRNCARSQLSTN
jgi:hypothetical protein